MSLSVAARGFVSSNDARFPVAARHRRRHRLRARVQRAPDTMFVGASRKVAAGYSGSLTDSELAAGPGDASAGLSSARRVEPERASPPRRVATTRPDAQHRPLRRVGDAPRGRARRAGRRRGRRPAAAARRRRPPRGAWRAARPCRSSSRSTRYRPFAAARFASAPQPPGEREPDRRRTRSLPSERRDDRAPQTRAPMHVRVPRRARRRPRRRRRPGATSTTRTPTTFAASSRSAPERRDEQALEDAVAALEARRDAERHHRRRQHAQARGSPASRSRRGAAPAATRRATVEKNTSSPTGIADGEEQRLAAPERHAHLGARLGDAAPLTPPPRRRLGAGRRGAVGPTIAT